MNTRHAQIILTTLREGSFTAGARALFITQPTLSQTVKQIETQLGEPIFVRGRTPLLLTPAGELYVQAARRMLQIETQLDEALCQLHGQTKGVLRIGFMLHRSDELLPQVLPDFLNRYPDVRVQVSEGTAEELVRRLLACELDMAMIVDYTRHPDLNYRQVASDEIVLLAGRSTPLANRIPSGSTISLTEIKDERLILPSIGNPSRPSFDSLLDSFGLHPVPAVTCDNVSTAKRLCIACSMVMLSPFLSLLCDSAGMQKLAHYHLGQEAYLPPLCMAHAKNEPLAPYAETMFSLLTSRFRAMAAYRA